MPLCDLNFLSSWSSVSVTLQAFGTKYLSRVNYEEWVLSGFVFPLQQQQCDLWSRDAGIPEAYREEKEGPALDDILQPPSSHLLNGYDFSNSSTSWAPSTQTHDL